MASPGPRLEMKKKYFYIVGKCKNIISSDSDVPNGHWETMRERESDWESDQVEISIIDCVGTTTKFI